MLTNTHLFQEEANRFRKDGVYINAPKQSIGYREYWDEQTKRCLEGITIGNLWIPGTYYFYLNFTQILRKIEGVKEKKLDFPRFTDVDLEFFLLYERAIKEDKGIILVKPRRTGFSYKMRTLAAHKYTFTRNSSTLIGAYDSEYSDGTMGMTLSALNFINEHTEWKKQRNPDTSDFIQARYEKVLPNGVKVWKGSMSQIQSLTFRNNPFASAGKSANLFIFEEGGLFQNIIDSYNISEPCWKDGDEMIGTPIVFGSAGDMGGGTIQFHQMFYDPEAYNLLALENIWDKDKIGQKCGWFFPASRQRFGKYKDKSGKYPEYNGVEMVDKDGNSLQFLGEQAILDEREKKKTSEKAYKDHKTQFPLDLFEAFLRNTGVYFPAIDLQYVLAEIETNRILMQSFYTGDLILTENQVRPILQPTDKTPIHDFPLKNIDIIDGAIEIYEKPIANVDGRVISGRYIIGNDPVDDGGNDNLDNSLQSALVMDLFTDRIVAEYTGRTKDTKVFYENVRRLALYYNAEINYENNKKGLFAYMNSLNCLDLLCDVPSYLKETDLVKGDTTSGNRKKGTPTTGKYMVKHYEDLINSYLLQPAVDREGLQNLHTIRSIGLLKELIAYDRVVNTDRVSALAMLMVLREEKLKYIDKAKKPVEKNFTDDKFFNRFDKKGSKLHR